MLFLRPVPAGDDEKLIVLSNGTVLGLVDSSGQLSAVIAFYDDRLHLGNPMDYTDARVDYGATEIGYSEVSELVYTFQVGGVVFSFDENSGIITPAVDSDYPDV